MRRLAEGGRGRGGVFGEGGEKGRLSLLPQDILIILADNQVTVDCQIQGLLAM